MSKKPTDTKTAKTLDPEEVWFTADSYYWVGRAVVEVTKELEEDGFLPKGSAKEIEEDFGAGPSQFIYEDDLLITARDYISEWIYRQFPELPRESEGPLYARNTGDTDAVNAKTMDELWEIGREVTSGYGGECAEVEIDTKNKEVFFHCVEHGEWFSLRMSFKELKKKYNLTIKTHKKAA